MNEGVVENGAVRVRRDPWLIAISALGFLLTLAGWTWIGGGVYQRVQANESRLASAEVKIDAITRDDAKRDAAIAVIDTKLAFIKETVSHIDSNLNEIKTLQKGHDK